MVCAFKRTVSKVDYFLASGAKGTKVVGAHSLEDMVSKLKKPQRILILVKAGLAIDDFIEKLAPWLDTGDVLTDGGNSGTGIQCQDLKAKGILFVGSAIGGGEEGARYSLHLCPERTKEPGPISRRYSMASLQK